MSEGGREGKREEGMEGEGRGRGAEERGAYRQHKACFMRVVAVHAP